jgi:glycosyl transferase family 11
MAITFTQLGSLGRAGNQLFQLASTIGTAINDTYIFPKWKYEPFFNLHGCFTDYVSFASTYNEPHFHYAPIPYKPNLNLSGYFQSYRYWQGQEETIKGLLTPKHKLTPNNMTAIHCRRGDYVNLAHYHNLCDMNYYNRAMQLCPSEKYMIFSDDITWCKNNFKGNQFVFSEGKNEVEDLSLMMVCANNILSASSFSWWGAYLNNNASKRVIAPARWFGEKLPHTTSDLLPTEWIKI